MKKIILLILSLIISGCTDRHTLNINSIQTINYNMINLIERDFNLVLNEINKLEFKEEKNDGNFNDKLKIVSDERIYDFKLYDNIIFYEEDNKTYVTNNIDSLNDILKQLEQEYTDFSFFDISYDICEINNNNSVIKIDNTNNCLLLNIDKIIYNFRINSIEAIEDYFIEDNLLYQKDEIKSDNIIIKIDILTTLKFKISFNTEYNYTISMLPIYNQDNGEIDFNTSYDQKK